MGLLGQRLENKAGIKDAPSIDAVFELGAAKLLMGNLVARNSVDVMQEHSITRVVDCLEPGAFREVPRLEHPGVTYLQFPVADWEDCRGARTDAGLARILSPLLGFVEDGLAAGENVLVHCFAGAHRSGAAGIACMMHMQGLSSEAALEAARARRPCVDIFSNMQKLLSSFEKLLTRSDLSPEIAAAREEGYASVAGRVFAEAAAA